jgi:hypothetical protein
VQDPRATSGEGLLVVSNMAEGIIVTREGEQEVKRT